MANASWVCFACRCAVRRPTQHEGDVACPECRAACWPLGYKVPVPQKHDVRAWRELARTQQEERARRRAAAARARVRARHELEREIAWLASLPENAGRTRAIRLLRQQLADT